LFRRKEVETGTSGVPKRTGGAEKKKNRCLFVSHFRQTRQRTKCKMCFHARKTYAHRGDRTLYAGGTGFTKSPLQGAQLRVFPRLTSAGYLRWGKGKKGRAVPSPSVAQGTFPALELEVRPTKKGGERRDDREKRKGRFGRGTQPTNVNRKPKVDTHAVSNVPSVLSPSPRGRISGRPRGEHSIGASRGRCLGRKEHWRRHTSNTAKKLVNDTSGRIKTRPVP